MAAAALALTVSITSPVSAAAPTIDANAAGQIAGSGATFPVNQYTKWFTRFTAANQETTPITTGTSLKQFHTSNSSASLVLSYNGVGSSTGIANFYGANRRRATQMFSGTDSVLSSSQRTSISGTDIGSNYEVIPAISGPISIVYNISNLKTLNNQPATLRLDGETICGIYAGQIKTWNDAKIAALNPTVNLPSSTITVVGRSDGSGTTFIFSSYLGRAAAANQKMCGYHSSFVSNTTSNFDGAAGSFRPINTAPGTYFGAIRNANGANPIVGQSGNPGVASYVKANANTIGYVESSFVTTNSLTEAPVAAKDLRSGAKVFLRPTAATVTSALTNAVTGEDPINPSVNFVQPVFASGVNSYPIVGYSWLMVYTRYTDATVTKQQVQGMIAFMNWALTTGQSSANLATGYVPLPTAVATAAIARLKQIQWNGETVWP
jgi:phosphate ABC transporter phosphate-binding protein